MSFTDLSNIADQVKPPPQRQQQPPQEPDPAQQPPDPRSIQPPGQTNPVSALQTQVPPPQIPSGLRAEAQPDETKIATADDVNFPPPLFPPAIYRPPTDSRGPSGWGTEPEPVKMANSYAGVASNPDLPSVPESYPEVSKSGEYLHEFAAPSVAEPAWRASLVASPLTWLLDGISQGRFSRNFNVADLRRVQAQQAELLLNTRQAWDNHANFMLGAGRIMLGADPNHPLQTMQQMEDYLNQHNHHFLIGTLHRGGLPAVERALNEEDRQIRRMMGASSQIGKAAKGVEEEDRAAGAYGLPSRTGNEGGGDNALNIPGLGARRPPPPSDTSDMTDADNEIARQFPGTTPQVMRAAHDMLLGRPLKYPVPEGGPTDYAIRDRYAALDKTVRDIGRYQNPDPNLTPQQKIEEKLGMYARVDPELSGHLRGLTDYKVDPKSEEGKRWVQLAGQLDPNYRAGNYALVSKFSDPGAKENEVITRVGNLDQNYLNFARALNSTVENKPIPSRVIDSWLAGKVTGEPQYDAIYNNLFTLGTQLNAILTLTGTPRVGLVNDWLKSMKSTGSPRSLRTQIQQDFSDAFRTLTGYQDQWERVTGKNTLLPGLSPESYQLMRAIVRSNPSTGEVPADAPSALKSVGRKITDAERMKKGTDQLDPDKLPPLTMTEVHQLQDFIKLNSQSPDPDKRQQAQIAEKRLGPQLGLGRRIQGVDEDTNARDAEIDKLLRPGGKTIFGYGDEAPKAAPTGEAPAATDGGLGLHAGGTPYEQMSVRGKLGQGVVHGMADIATGAGRLASKALPESVSNFVSEHGGQRVADFSDRPYEGPLEMTGSALGQGASMMMGGGEMRLGELLARNLPKNIPYLQMAKYFPWRGWGINPAFIKAQRAAKVGGDVAEAGARGAAGGAIANPENPGQGAAVGAAAAPLGPLVKGAVHSPLGRFLGEYGAPSAAYAAAHAATGVPFHPIGQAITWHSSPVGRRLRQFGRHIVDDFGDIVGTVMTPQTSGYVAGRPGVSDPAVQAGQAGVETAGTLMRGR